MLFHSTFQQTSAVCLLQSCGFYSLLTFDFDFDFDDTRFRSFQSQDHVQVLKTETDWPRWYGDGANQIICDKNWNWPRWGQTDR